MTNVFFGFISNAEIRHLAWRKGCVTGQFDGAAAVGRGIWNRGRAIVACGFRADEMTMGFVSRRYAMGQLWGIAWALNSVREKELARIAKVAAGIIADLSFDWRYGTVTTCSSSAAFCSRRLIAARQMVEKSMIHSNRLKLFSSEVSV